MAIVKIIAIRDRLDKRVNYAINSEKTTLDGHYLRRKFRENKAAVLCVCH